VNRKNREVWPVTMIETEPLMTPQEVADFLAMPVLTLQTWRAKRTGPRAYRVGRHVRYRREDVDRWLAERTTQVSGDSPTSARKEVDEQERA
jgi:excisionase family DNA binding protein